MTDNQDSKMTSDCKAGWMPIETAPRDGTHILLSEGFNVWEGRAVEDRGDFQWWERNAHPTDYCGSQDYPTHWMPLPPPPNND